MYLVEKTTGKKILLAKYYPPKTGFTSSWYVYYPADDIDRWLREVSEELIKTNIASIMWGPTSFVLEFEHQVAPKP